MSAATIPFEWTWTGKAATFELDSGDLLLEGWMVRFDETDREGERWDATSNVLIRSIEKFVREGGPLVHHHDFKTVLGKVVEHEVVPGVGVKVRAVVHHQPEGSPWRHLYLAAKRGVLSRMSSGGIFKRKSTPSGPVLVDADFLELSLCSQSVGRGTTARIIGAKALACPDGKAIRGDGTYTDAPGDVDLEVLHAKLNRMEVDVAELRLRRALEAVR